MHKSSRLGSSQWVDKYSFVTDANGIVVFDGLPYCEVDPDAFRLAYDGQFSSSLSREQSEVDVQVEIILAATIGFIFAESVGTLSYLKKFLKSVKFSNLGIYRLL